MTDNNASEPRDQPAEQPQVAYWDVITKPQTPENYEFTLSQNVTIGELAGRMRVVGLFMIIGGILSCFAILLGQYSGVILGVVNVVLGIWTRKAAREFQLIVDTQGKDLQHLMDALKYLLWLYTLQWFLIVISILVLAILLPVFLFTPAGDILRS